MVLKFPDKANFYKAFTWTMRKEGYLLYSNFLWHLPAVQPPVAWVELD